MNQADFDRELQKARQFMHLKRYPEALALYAQLTAQFQSVPLWFEYGSAASGTGDFELADQVWQKLISREPKNATLLWRLAGEYAKLFLFTKAGALFARAASLEPGNLEIQLSLTTHLSRTTGGNEARAALKKCLELNLNSEWARFYSAHLDRFEDKVGEAEKKLHDLIASAPQDQQVLSSCHLELARIYDRTQRFDEAWAELEKAKKIATQYIDVDAQRKAFDERREKTLRTTHSLPKNILDIWGGQFPPEARSAAAPQAILGGHIRSGTTLVERIIDAHPATAAYDESLSFQTVVPLIDITAPEIPTEKLNFLRRRYQKNLTVDSGPPGEGKILLDKNPGATTSLPALLRIFPEMRVLIALRDPRDIMVSCYFIRPIHVIHLSLERMALNYSCVMDVWLAVREWQGLNWMETRYEDVVADLEKEGRRVTDFLGLKWHENQARFYESNPEKPVKNYNEVTKPVYARAIGRWRAYEKYLAPVMPILEPYCRKFGYT